MNNRRLGKKMSSLNKIALLTFCSALFIAGSAAAKPGDVAKGKGIYDKRCTWCHGADGDGAGAAKDRLNPRHGILRPATKIKL
jgi:mono/diheme cytochrome c family protein